MSDPKLLHVAPCFLRFEALQPQLPRFVMGPTGVSGEKGPVAPQGVASQGRNFTRRVWSGAGVWANNQHLSKIVAVVQVSN